MMEIANERTVSFEHLEALYIRHLGDDDRPSCYTAYCRAEAVIFDETGARKCKNYHTFRTMLWRFRRRKKQHSTV